MWPRRRAAESRKNGSQSCERDVVWFFNHFVPVARAIDPAEIDAATPPPPKRHTATPEPELQLYSHEKTKLKQQLEKRFSIASWKELKKEKES